MKLALSSFVSVVKVEGGGRLLRGGPGHEWSQPRSSSTHRLQGRSTGASARSRGRLVGSWRSSSLAAAGDTTEACCGTVKPKGWCFSALKVNTNQYGRTFEDRSLNWERCPKVLLYENSQESVEHRSVRKDHHVCQKMIRYCIWSCFIGKKIWF